LTTTNEYETGVDEEPEVYTEVTDPANQEEVAWAIERGEADTIEEALEYVREHKRQFGER